MKAVMKIYVVKGSFFLEEESEAEKDHTKEGRTSKKDLSTLLMTEEKLQWEEVTFSNMEKPKRPLRTEGSRSDRRNRYRGISHRLFHWN